DVHVMLLRPKRGHGGISRIAAGGVAAGNRPMLLGMPPVLQPYRSMRSGKARAVARREDRGIAGARMAIDHDAVLRGEARLPRQPIVGDDAGADADQIGPNGAALRFDREPAVGELT